MTFQKKLLFGTIWLVVLAPKWYTLIALDLLSGFFYFKFCTIKEAKRYMEILLLGFEERISFGAI